MFIPTRRHSLRRPFVMAAVAAALGFCFVIIPGNLSPEQAAQAASPGNVGPINVLPSLVTGSAKVGTTEVYSALLYKFVLSAMTQKAAAAKLAGGTQTAANVAELAAEKSRYRVPAIQPIKLIKAAGSAQSAFSTLDFGITIGAGIAPQILGVDTNNLVCSATANQPGGGFVNFLSGQNCAGWTAAPGFVPNQDADPWVTGPNFCSTVDASICAQLIGTASYATSGTTPQGLMYMFVKTGGDTYMNYRYANTSPTTKPGTTTSTARDADNFYRSMFISSSPGSTTSTVNNLCRDAFLAAGYSYSANNKCAAVPNSEITDNGYATQYNPNETTRATAGFPRATTTVKPGNPVRTLRCDFIGTNGTTYTGANVTYQQADTLWTPPTCPTLPSGVTPSTTKIIETPSGKPPVELGSAPTTPEYLGAVRDYPLCLDGSCALQLHKAGTTAVCHDAGETCAGWFTDADKASKYSCTWGSYAVDLGQCNVYAPSFTPQSRTTGNTLGNPTTGEAMTSPVRSGADAGMFATPVQNPVLSRECLPSGWGLFNPVEWVFKPIQCGLEWAFIPRVSAVTQAQTNLDAVLAGTTLGSISKATTALSAGFAGGASGCSGPPWHIRAFGINETYYPFSACNEPVKGAAAMVNSMLAITTLFVTVLASTRYIAGTIGFIGLGSTAVRDAKVGKE